MDFFRKIFHHPNFNAVAGLFGIVGTILAIYFGLDSIKKPDLTYYISPTRTPILQKGSLTNLSVAYRGLQIDGDLSSAVIQIWNQGKQAIHGGDRAHGGDILEPILIRTTNRARIYETTISSSRNAIGIDPTTTLSNLGSGIVPINFTILEQNDGIKVQIIYGGDVDLPLILDGIIEGQPNGVTNFGNSSHRTSKSKSDMIFSIVLMIVIGALGISQLFELRNDATTAKKTEIGEPFLITRRRLGIFISALLFTMSLATLVKLLSSYPHIPPFGL